MPDSCSGQASRQLNSLQRLKVRWATEEEIFRMIDSGEFIPYEKSLISLLFFRRNHRSSHTGSDPTAS